MPKSITELMKYALSGSDIVKALHHETNIMTYKEILDTHNLVTLLGEYGSCVILYETKPGYGHWCCIFEVNPGLIEFFDAYGSMIDETIHHATGELKKIYESNSPKIIELLLRSTYDKIEYNNYPIQKHAKGINTCGRHVVVRLLNRRLPLDFYYHMLQLSGDDYDVTVTKLTDDIG